MTQALRDSSNIVGVMKDLCSHNCCAVKGAMYVTPWCDMLRGRDSSCSVLHLWYKMDVLRREARKRLAYLGISNGYQNVPDVNDLVGVEPSGTPTPLQFFFSPSEIQNQAKSMLAYLGVANGYQNIPNIDDLVSTYNSTSGTQLLLSFPLATLKEEIEKKTAYLGKFRRTEEAVHLLDLIAVTGDESELLLSFAKEAMMDVWNILSAPFVSVAKSVWWQDIAATSYQVGVHYQFGVNYNTSYDINPLKQAILNALVERIIYKWLLYAYPSDAAQYDTNFQQATAEVQACCKDFKARAANIFAPLAKEAMMDVWNILSTPFVAVSKKAWWQESATTTYQAGAYYHFDVNYVLTTEEKDALQRILLEAIVARVISKWLVLAYPVEAPKFDAAYQQAIAAIPQRVNEFKARWSGLFVPFTKSAMADVYAVLNRYMPRHEKAYWFREGRDTVSFDSSGTDPNLLHLSQLSEVDDEGFLIADNIPVDDEGYIRIAETAVDDEGYIISDGSETEPVTFYAGQYVIMDGDLYIAIEDGDSSDYIGKIVPTEDYRDSVHYGILWHCQHNINAVEPLDTAIFESLVARIVYKWVAKAYPMEAEVYLAEYNENAERIREFARIMEGPQIVNRIPRIY